MKKFLTAVVIVVSTMTFAQQTDKCDLPKNYQEPKPDKKIQSWLKRFGAVTIEDLRKYIAFENDCQEIDITFLRIAETKTNGIYSACVKGKEMKYKRIGTAFMRNDEETIFDTANSGK
jgi:hypothetical protein